MQAVADHRIDMSLRTRLADGSAVVDMVEHVLAALSGLKIDNVEIHCTACEMPGLDGSKPRLHVGLEAAGRTIQNLQARNLRITKKSASAATHSG